MTFQKKAIMQQLSAKPMTSVKTTSTCTKTMKKPRAITKRKVTNDTTTTTTTKKVKSQDALRKETSRARESPAKKRLRNEKNAHRMRMSRLRKKSESITRDLKRLLTDLEVEHVQDRSDKYRQYLVRAWFAIHRPRMEFNEKIISKSLSIFMEKADMNALFFSPRKPSEH